MRYSILADINLSHEYYRGSCSSFCFVPSAESEKEIRSRSLLVREVSGCLRILTPDNGCDGLESLFFGVGLKDPGLWGVSQLDCPEGDGIPMAVVKDGAVSFARSTKDEDEKALGNVKPLFALKILVGGSAKGHGVVEIPLKTRTCRWIYTVQGNENLDDLAVCSLRNDGKPCFTAERMGAHQVVFSSRDGYPIVFGDTPRFQLRTRKTSRIVLKALPNMDTRSLSRKELNGGGYEVVAESFVNL